MSRRKGPFGRPGRDRCPVPSSNPQTMVRAYEVEVVTAAGQHRYIVAIDVEASYHA
jgi:hypothetical protein